MGIWTYGRLFHDAGYLAGLLVIVFALNAAHAADTSQCGFMACENSLVYQAAHGNSGCEGKCELKSDGSGVVQAWGRNTTGSTASCAAFLPDGVWRIWGSYPACNCSAQPDIDADSNIRLVNGKTCKAGCQYAPKGPTVSVCGIADSTACNAGGAWKPTGAQCNPVHPEVGPAPPVICDGDDCLEPLIPPPPAPPEICGTHDGKSVGCVTPPNCSKNANGYICAGNPPPNPPPATPPNETPTPDYSNPNSSYCSGAGSCSPITINMGGPDGPPPGDGGNCPAGSHMSGGKCVSDVANSCPDGSTPINNRCPAPPGNCADGTAPASDGKCSPGWRDCPDGAKPVNGQCTPSDPTTCPDGSKPVSGKCPAQAYCPSGGLPVNGRCGAVGGTCPNGAQPVNGMCEVGTPCNPATDPNHCQGAPNGNAGGGGTCSAAPFCSGDPIMCQVLAQQWQTRCAVDRLGKWPDGQPLPDGHAGESPGDTQVLTDNGGELLGQVRDTGFLGGGTCPRLRTFVAFGHTYDLGAWSLWCDAMSAVSGVFLFIGAFIAMRILSGG